MVRIFIECWGKSRMVFAVVEDGMLLPSSARALATPPSILNVHVEQGPATAVNRLAHSL